MTTAKEILQNIFKHDNFRNDQEEIIDKIMADEHCLVLMPTGMGKSLCFQIPALSKKSKVWKASNTTQSTTMQIIKL